MPEICEVCNKTYSRQGNLNKHLQYVHKTAKFLYDKSIHNYKCLECECNSSFRINIDLVHHLRDKHGLQFHVEELHFQTFHDFRAWKEEIEVNENCNYVSPRGRKTIGRESHELLYYVCNRSVNNNMSKNKAKPGEKVERKRLTKSQGVSKLKFNCTSQINVVIDEKGKIKMKRIKTHYGHQTEIQHLRLGDKTCQVVASQLINGASTSRILDTNRRKIGKTMKRADLMTRQDVFNIKNRFKIDIVEGVKHTNDAISIDLWVRDCKSNGEDIVLFYKRQGDKMDKFEDSDFCLVLMTDYQKYMLEMFGSNIITVDSTHGLNNYDFELTTIMIVDEFDEGFPIAFMFTNRKDTEVHKIFFDCVKKKAGIIKTNTFMSDITQVFYNAWVCVMGVAIHLQYKCSGWISTVCFIKF